MSRPNDPQWLSYEWLREHQHDTDGARRLIMWQLDQLAKQDEQSTGSEDTEPSGDDDA